MKKLVGFLVFISLLVLYCINAKSKQNPSTTVIVKNSSDSVMTVYLTLGGDTSWVNNVSGIFGITTSGLQGSFVLQSNDSVSYTSVKPMQGNISFGSAPLNCPIGITLYEFCLNNFGTVNDAQETVEISCVAGVSSIGKFELNGGGEWSATTSYPNVTSIKNDTIGANTNLVGVYPYGCTNCTNTAGMPTCITSPETCDNANICNVQRNAKNSGGTVKIEFLKINKQSISVRDSI